MAGEPFAFTFETARDLVRLLKKSKNGEFAPELSTLSPQDQSARFVWAYVPSSITGTYDNTVKAWKLVGATTMFPMNIGKESTGKWQWGKIDEYGIINGGITCTIWVPSQTGTTTAPTVGAGFYLGKVFSFDANTNDPMVLIAKPPAAGTGGGAGNAVIDVVTDVTCDPVNGLVISTVTLSGADYDNAVIRNFLALSDVDAKSYVGNAGRVVQVNATADGLEFGDIVTGVSDSFISLTDTPPSYGSTNTYKVLTVSSSNAGISFSDNNITTKNSITGGGNPNNPSTYAKLELVNDEETPVAYSFYGADGASEKGFHTISFKNLNDTPNSYTGEGGKFLKINTGATGIEFADVDLATLQTDVTNLQTDLGIAQADIVTLQGDVSTHTSDISSIQSSISTINTDLGTITSQLSTIQTDVTNLLSDVAGNSSDITDILGRLATAEANIISLQTDLATAQADITNNYNSLDARITALGG